MVDNNDSLELVLSYIEAAQHARASSEWTDEPWRVVLTGADALIERLQAPINDATTLTTLNVNAQRAGDHDILVEQLSTLTDELGEHVSMVCHIFTVDNGLITAVRAYRNDRGLPIG